MDLKVYGWSSFFEQNFKTFSARGYLPGRVALEHKHIYRVHTGYGEVLAEVSGKLRYNASLREDYPAVGDWVVMAVRAGENRATIQAVLPRKSKFSRKAAGANTAEQIVAANIDTVFLVNALNQEFNVRRNERYLTMAWESGASPVIVLNKADLCGNIAGRVAEVESVAPGVPVHVISCAQNNGLESLSPYLDKKGHTVALLGSSGVGKSTLTNLLTGKELQQVNEVREGDDRGRHTTTYRELILLPSGAMVIDTPGMRELQLWDAGEGLKDTFADIERLARECRFRDCRHEKEPHCAVQKALREEALDPSRFANYLKLQKELELLAGKDNLEVKLARKSFEKQLSKLQKRLKNR